MRGAMLIADCDESTPALPTVTSNAAYTAQCMRVISAGRTDFKAIV
jgi:hypothetical protein